MSFNQEKEYSVNKFLDLALEPLDDVEAPMSNGEGVGVVLIAFGTGLILGALIT